MSSSQTPATSPRHEPNSVDDAIESAVVQGNTQILSQSHKQGDEVHIEPTERIQSVTSIDSHNDDINIPRSTVNEEGDGDLDLESRPTEPLYTVFTSGQKRFIVFLTACAGFFSAVSANIYFPALNSLTKEFDVSPTAINLTLTSYTILKS